MAKTYYELLEVDAAATADEIKRAFRREIAKYHPDKVQHLGQEFQDIAVSRAAELTQAYKTLTNPATREEYDASIAAAGTEFAHVTQPAAPPHAGTAGPGAPQDDAHRPDASPRRQGSTPLDQDRAGASDLIHRATVARFRDALRTELGRCEESALPGFHVSCVPKPSFWMLKPPPGVLGRFVAEVDAAAVQETWALATRARQDPQRDLVVFVMGPAVAAPSQLAAAIAEQRRKTPPASGRVVLVPVSTRNWNAHVPTDAPALVKSLLGRLKSA